MKVFTDTNILVKIWGLYRHEESIENPYDLQLHKKQPNVKMTDEQNNENNAILAKRLFYLAQHEKIQVCVVPQIINEITEYMNIESLKIFEQFLNKYVIRFYPSEQQEYQIFNLRKDYATKPIEKHYRKDGEEHIAHVIAIDNAETAPKDGEHNNYKDSIIMAEILVSEISQTVLSEDKIFRQMNNRIVQAVNSLHGYEPMKFDIYNIEQFFSNHFQANPINEEQTVVTKVQEETKELHKTDAIILEQQVKFETQYDNG